MGFYILYIFAAWCGVLKFDKSCSLTVSKIWRYLQLQLLLKFDNPQNLQVQAQLSQLPQNLQLLEICSSFKIWQWRRLSKAGAGLTYVQAWRIRWERDKIFINVCERPGNHMLRPPSSHARAIIVPNKKEDFRPPKNFSVKYQLSFFFSFHVQFTIYFNYFLISKITVKRAIR